MSEFSHLLEYSSDEKKIIVSRIFWDGRKVLYTEVDIPNSIEGLDAKAFMARFSETLFLDSSAMRKALGL